MHTKIDFSIQTALLKMDKWQISCQPSVSCPTQCSVYAASSSMGRGRDDVRLIDMKVMSPKKFDGKLDTPFRAWAKAYRAYCNASKPGFRKYLR